MIDFHCHLDLYPAPEEIVREADRAGIYVLSVTTTPRAFNETAKLARGCKRIRTALGLHPQLAHERFGELALFEALLPQTRYVGEIGLDGSPEYSPHAKAQGRVFEHALKLAQSHGGRILTIHSRRAAGEVLETLGRYPSAGPAILHWFSGTERQLREAIAMGCWFSVGPPMLRSIKGRRLAGLMPPSRMLTETDGPFGQAGRRPLTPLDSWQAVEQLAELWGVERPEVEIRLKDNLRAITALVPPLSDPPSMGRM